MKDGKIRFRINVDGEIDERAFLKINKMVDLD